MNIAQMLEKVKEIKAANEDEYWYIGIRYEDKDREIGEICECSRHNVDHEDQHDFPEYGTAEYDEMEVLNGTSAYNLDALTNRYLPGCGKVTRIYYEAEASSYFCRDHCYIVASNSKGSHDDPDEDEILIRDAKVIAKLF